VAWQQVMPVRMNPEGKTLAGSFTIPIGTTKVAARLLIDAADLLVYAGTIRISIQNDATGDNIIASQYGGDFMRRHGTPSFGYYKYDKSSSTYEDIGGLTLAFSIDTTQSLRFGAEAEIL
jgi:hypothetical protein